jgi:hypothetical protein
MTARIPENLSTVVGDAEPDDDLEPAVVREPDE